MTKVRVRMYRQFLGDCFLVSFGENAAHMLIDCGVIGGTEGATELMQKVAQDIKSATNGHIDVLVATHEHWDHLSGFLQAQNIFDPFEFKNVWLAWTEDPNDELADSLRKKRQQTADTVRMAIARLGMLGVEGQRLAGRLSTLSAFYEGEVGLGATGRATTGDALDWVKRRTKPRFLTPGDKPLEIANVQGIRIYVLGPPRDIALIKKDLPSKRDPETYGMALTGGLEEAFLAAALAYNKEPPGRSEDEDQAILRSQPFDAHFQLSPDQAKTMTFFQEHYGFDGPAPSPTAWRRIDNDWLGVAEQLALQLDSDTNNTSLVLAVELIESGKVLLFAADAQVGNWLSWQDLSWKVPDKDGNTHEVTAADLLRRIVLYKVGHHGSHNATLREKGLELMTSSELTAMIPVDEKMAQKKGWGRMPFAPLLARLGEKTSGRILRSDEEFDSGQPDRKPLPAGIVEGPDGLYFDFAVEG